MLFGMGYDGLTTADGRVNAGITLGQDMLDQYELNQGTSSAYSMVYHSGVTEDGTCTIGAVDCDWNVDPSEGGFHYSMFSLTKGLGEFIAPNLTVASNWYAKVVDLLLIQQAAEGSWPIDGRDDATTLFATDLSVASLGLVAVPPTLSVAKNGTGVGTVTSAPAGISCGATCSHAYTSGTSITLTATANAGSAFTGWSGAGCSGTGTCVVTLNSDTTVTATFSTSPTKPTSLSTSLSGGGFSGPKITVPTNTAVTDSATLSGDNAASAGGTVTYTVFSDATCQTMIASGGTKPVVAGSVPNSNAVTLANVGTYYWQASYSGDSSNGISASTCGDEVETVQTETNHAPVADPQCVNTQRDTPVPIKLTGSDADGNPLTYTIVSPPQHGTLSGTAPNLVYTPNAGYTGSDSFTFTVNDGHVTSAPANVGITIVAPRKHRRCHSQSTSNRGSCRCWHVDRSHKELRVVNHGYRAVKVTVFVNGHPKSFGELDRGATRTYDLAPYTGRQPWNDVTVTLTSPSATFQNVSLSL
jgi:hypothetical protein